MKNKIWIDADIWIEKYNEQQLQLWYQDKKKYQKKSKVTKGAEK